MKTSRFLIDKVTVDLTCMTCMSISDGVRDHLQPIVAKSSKLISKLRSGLVSSICTVMSFLKCLMCLFV